MVTTRIEYKKRLDEIDSYFSSFKVLDSGSCVISYTSLMGDTTEIPINDSLSKIIKANGFLLLYNLIEATVRNSIDAVMNAIKSENCSYKLLSDKIRLLWIKQETKNIVDINQKRNEIKIFAEKILEHALLEISSDSITISGNIDAQEIRKISEQIGCDIVADGRNLKTIKDKRNKLAHGEKTFSELGKDISVSDLIEYKNDVKSYLDSVLITIEDYISQKKYMQHA